MEDAEKGSNAIIEVDLRQQTVTSSEGQAFHFEVDEFKKHCLLNGLDEISITLEKVDAIDSHEAKVAIMHPWV